MNRFIFGLIMLAFVATTACARHVVVDPATVASRNDTEWNIHAQPVQQVQLPAQPVAAAPTR